MSITPADIQQQRFSEAKRGYDPQEVDVFLEQIAKDIDLMLRKIADLKGRLNNAERELAAAKSQSAMAVPAAAPVYGNQISDTSASPSQVAAALIVAQQTSDKMISDARIEADKIRVEADSRAREIIRKALAEKQDELAEIERLKESREEFRASYVKLVKHFEDEANAVFPEAMLTSPKYFPENEQHIEASISAPIAPAAVPVAPVPVVQDNDLGLDDLD